MQVSQIAAPEYILLKLFCSSRQDGEGGGQGGSKLPSGKILRGGQGDPNFPQARL